MNNIEQKALVFDLGNVLLPINLELTYQAFANYTSNYSAEQIKTITEEEKLWYEFEKGLISEENFRKKIINRFNLTCSFDEFDKAFNALLIHVPKDSLDFIQACFQSYDSLYLLSNTSSIHAKVYREKAFSLDLFDYFKNLFLSFEIKLIKPELSIYHYLSERIQKNYDDILFFDDNLGNIEAAKSLGIHSFLVDPSNRINSMKPFIF